MHRRGRMAHAAARILNASTDEVGRRTDGRAQERPVPVPTAADATRSTTRLRSSTPRTTTIGSWSAVDEANDRPRVDMESNRGCRWVCDSHDRSHRRHPLVDLEQPCFVAMTTVERDGLTLIG